MDKIALQFVFIFQVLCPHACLATGAFVPKAFEAFIPADVDVFVREQGSDFRQHFVHKLECFFLPNAKRVFVFTIEFVSDIDRRRRFHTSQFRISDECRQTVARHVDFRDDTHIAFGRIRQHLFDVFLRVESAVCRFLARLLWLTMPPSLIVRQVPVENVHLILGKLVNVFLDLFFREPMATDIEHHPAPRKLWFIRDVHASNLPYLVFLFFFSSDFWRKHL